jgi:hypothetical protein
LVLGTLNFGELTGETASFEIIDPDKLEKRTGF